MMSAEEHIRFSMARLLERLIDEDYIRPEREAELRDRTRHFERGDGFVTTKELEQKQETEDLLS